MADISKLRFNGTDYNVKDASAPARPLGNGYSKTGTLPISSTDTISEAIGKLENNIGSGGGGAVDSITIGGGSTTYTPDANGNVDLPAYPSYSNATTTKSGLMSSTDKSKLNGIDSSANYYVHPSDGDAGYYGPSSNASPGVGDSFSVPYLHVNSKGHVDVAYTRTITLPSNASTSSSGFMSYSDKTMVNNIGGQSISAANFNNLKTPGCYWIPSSGSSNMPWKNGEKVHLLVYKPDPSSTQNIVQIARAINYPKQMFIRTCYSGTWTNWFKFEGAEVTS